MVNALSSTSYFGDSRAFVIEDSCAYNVEFKGQDFGTEDWAMYKRVDYILVD